MDGATAWARPSRRHSRDENADFGAENVRVSRHWGIRRLWAADGQPEERWVDLCLLTAQ